MMGNRIVFMLMVLCFGACQKKALDPEAYIRYLNDADNGLLKKVEVGDFKIEVQLRPIEYEMIQELGIDQVTKEKLDAGVKDNTQEFFLMRIGSKDNKTDALTNGLTEQREYFDRIGYLISTIDKDIYLVDEKDTMRCAMHHFERSYHLAGYHNILLVFERPQQKKTISEDQIFVYDDAILGIGKLTIRFDRKAIKNIPNILL